MFSKFDHFNLYLDAILTTYHPLLRRCWLLIPSPKFQFLPETVIVWHRMERESFKGTTRINCGRWMKLIYLVLISPPAKERLLSCEKVLSGTCNLNCTLVFRGGNGENALSPPSDSGGIYDSHCFATTPSSSNGNCSDLDLPRQVSL